ncbi:MAG: ABC transporter ATP-binding protein [Promethearchaeota archaeon]
MESNNVMQVSDSNLVIDVKNLTFAYDVQTVVDDISFTVKKGEVIGILGPNGAGKTTTIRLITGVLPLPRGPSSILIQGKDISREGRRCKMDFGIVPETSNAFLDLTVWENIVLSGKIYGLSKVSLANNANELLNVFGLQEKKNAKTKSLSKGLKQRLNFCLALLHDPPILILDEPTSGLDPISVNIVRQRINQFKEQGKTILLTTHDLLEAEKLCDKVLIMNKGRIISFKSPGELKNEFKTPMEVIFKITGNINSEIKNKLVKLDNVKIIAGDTFKLTTFDTFNDISELNRFFLENRLGSEIIKVNTTSLEEVFIRMIKDDNDRKIR